MVRLVTLLVVLLSAHSAAWSQLSVPCRLLLRGGGELANRTGDMEIVGRGNNGTLVGMTRIKTDARGAFTLQLLEDARHDFAIYLEDFKPLELPGIEVQRNTFSEREPLTFTIDRGRRSSLSGRVTLPDGTTPAGGVRVSLLVRRGLQSFSSPLQSAGRLADWTFVRHTETQADGSYRLDGVIEGEYALLVSASVWAQNSNPPRGHAILRYDSPPAALRDCMPVLVQNLVIGAEAEQRFNVRLERGGCLGGTIQDPTTHRGCPGHRISVSAFEDTNFAGTSQAPALLTVVSDAQGRFEIPGLLLGPYVLRVEDPDILAIVSAVGYALPADRAKEVRILSNAPRSITLEGRVRSSQGVPLPEVRVWLAGEGLLTRTAADGTFRIPQIAFWGPKDNETARVSMPHRDGGYFALRTKTRDSTIKLRFILPNGDSFEEEVKLAESGLVRRDFPAPK